MSMAEKNRRARQAKAHTERAHNDARMQKQTQLQQVLASQKGSAIRYIELSLQVRRAVVAKLLAVRTLNIDVGITPSPDDVDPQTAVIHRLEEVLAVLRRAP